jgi:ParB family transcriptional regulator, chromosome partitioning protein
MGALMARKDLLKDLIAGAGGAAAPSTAPRMTRGAIGAVSQSIADLKTRALIDVPADMIDDAGLPDRMDPDAGLEGLIASIRDHGQQVPVMLRHSPNHEGRYEVVYGRRRVAALCHLGLPVRAMVRDLDDRSLIVAQGQENTARRDLSFIEKARFAAAMVGLKFERQVICDALSIDKTVASRMLAVIDAIPEEVLQAVGPAPAAGRDRWLALAARAKDVPPDRLIAAAQGADSDARFATLFESLAPERTTGTPAPLSADGVQLGTLRRSGGKVRLDLDAGFGGWLAANIGRFHRDWQTATRDRDDPDQPPEGGTQKAKHD